MGGGWVDDEVAGRLFRSRDIRYVISVYRLLQ